MLNSGIRGAAIAGAMLMLYGSTAFGQQLGTVFLDYDGETGTPQGTVTALNANAFPGLGAGDTGDLQAAITANIQAKFQGFSINITDQLPSSGTFTRVVIGKTGSTNSGSLGVSDEIDFRNKRADNKVSILETPSVIAAHGSYNVSDAALDLAQTAEHELAHVLGLVHSDVVSTFEASGSATVNKNELMSAITTNANRFNKLTFGGYSQVKLDIDKGINVQPEIGPAVFTAGSQADPARAGDAGSTVATATTLTYDANGRVTALGTLGGADTSDLFKFTGKAGDHVTAEAFSQVLATSAAPFLGRIADPMDPVVALLDSTGALLSNEEYNMTTDFDGATGSNGAADFGSDSLLYDFVLPADGTFAVRVSGRAGKDLSGDYELLFIPEPSSAVLLIGMSGLFAVRRRRRNAA